LAPALIICCSPLLAESCLEVLESPYEKTKTSEMRVKAIRGWDKLLTWAFASKLSPYPVVSSAKPLIFRTTDPRLLEIEGRFGFFSIYYPLVGVVTESKQDLRIVQCLLDEVQEKIHDPTHRFFATEELLAKVLAYRNLEEGDKVQIEGTTYVVDRVIDLWHGMPAFGLVRAEGSGSPILLFRGTDLTLTKERGWASILSDLDVAGPGFRTFQRARLQIAAYLQEKKEAQTPARLVGFSLGGAFVLHCLIEMPELISHTTPSTIFSAPGIATTLASRWEELSEDKRPPHLLYLCQGDLVSQIGTFFSKGYEVKKPKPMQVIEAHATLMGLQREVILTPIAFNAETRSRKDAEKIENKLAEQE
jgi:hypothetical protein